MSKMNPRRYCQSDPLWGNKLIPGTNMPLKRIGCNDTCLAIGHSRLYPNNPLNPGEMADMIKFNRRGEVIHKQKFPGFAFVRRQWTWYTGLFAVTLDKKGGRTEYFDLKKWIASKKRFAVIAVNNNGHFVFAYYWGWRGLYIIDPIDGKEKLMKKFYRPCGYALYHKTK